MVACLRHFARALLGDRSGGASLEIIMIGAMSFVCATQVAALAGRSLQTNFAAVNAALALVGG